MAEKEKKSLTVKITGVLPSVNVIETTDYKDFDSLVKEYINKYRALPSIVGFTGNMIGLLKRLFDQLKISKLPSSLPSAISAMAKPPKNGSGAPGSSMPQSSISVSVYP